MRVAEAVAHKITVTNGGRFGQAFRNGACQQTQMPKLIGVGFLRFRNKMEMLQNFGSNSQRLNSLTVPGGIRFRLVRRQSLAEFIIDFQCADC